MLLLLVFNIFLSLFFAFTLPLSHSLVLNSKLFANHISFDFGPVIVFDSLGRDTICINKCSIFEKFYVINLVWCQHLGEPAAFICRTHSALHYTPTGLKHDATSDAHVHRPNTRVCCIYNQQAYDIFFFFPFYRAPFFSRVYSFVCFSFAVWKSVKLIKQT